MARHARARSKPSPDYMHGYVDGLKHAEQAVWSVITDKEMERLDQTGATLRLNKMFSKIIDDAMAGKGYRQPYRG